MPTPPVSKEQAIEAVELMDNLLAEGHRPPGATGSGRGAIAIAAETVGVTERSFRHRLYRGKELYGITLPWERPVKAAEFEAPVLPTGMRTAEEIKEARRHEYRRKKEAHDARQLIPVKVKLDGPIGVLHMGDPHVDDPGADFESIERHAQLINETEGLFGGNVGDNHNNWVGRLAHLYGEQELTKAEAWILVEDFISSVQWLYLIGGNHDVWSGAGDPLKWMTRNQAGVFENYGARIALRFPNGAEVRINSRHDFHGHSQWNTVHGPSKAAQMGWRDQILVCGHKHTSGYAILKCPMSGLVSHAIRVAGYKIFDRYADELGLPNQNISPAVVTVIDPEKADDDPGQVTVFHDVEAGARYLTMLRNG